MIEVILSKQVFGAIALGLTFAAFYPYIRGILREETRPHVFSWVIWALGTVVVFFAQLSDGAGIGAWPIGVSGVITMGVAILAWMKAGDTTIVKMDWVFLGLALSALPLWTCLVLGRRCARRMIFPMRKKCRCLGLARCEMGL